MNIKLNDTQKTVLRNHEVRLIKSSEINDLVGAKESVCAIQNVFIDDRNHYRLLQAKLCYFEIFLNLGKVKEALLGFEAIYIRAKGSSRTFLECNALLAVCYLRLGRLSQAKVKIAYVIDNTKNIKSETRRAQFYKRLIERIGEECILGQLIGQNQGVLEAEDIHRRSIELVKKSDSELLEEIAWSLPVGTQVVIADITSFSLQLVPFEDRKCLPAPVPKIPDSELGKKALAALKRIGWQTFCDSKSDVFKLWSKGIPKVFGQGYFSASIIATLGEWRIGIPQLAAGIVATAMKYGCAEFCKQFKPEGLMIPKNNRS